MPARGRELHDVREALQQLLRPAVANIHNSLGFDIAGRVCAVLAPGGTVMHCGALFDTTRKAKAAVA